ncbi:MAG: hypothetical protein Q9159_004110 [Coniocarpon cinnabarinum]
MSSPPAVPAPSAQNLAKSQSQRSHTQARPATGTNPSTPAPAATPGQHGTPSSNAFFLSPSTSRVGNIAGKTPMAGKTIVGKGPAGKGPWTQHATPAGAQFGSSPAAVNMMATPSLSGGGAGGVGGTTFDSPNHAALAAVGMEPTSSANAMGLSMSSLGLSSLGVHGTGGSMLPGMSQGMLGASSMGTGAQKLDDAERRRRLESVLLMLSERTGRISQEGLERLARRMGLEMYDEYRDGGRSLTLAGKSMFAVDVLFRPPSSPTVDQTTFSFHEVNEETIADFSPAAGILREDLSPPIGISAINAKLDSFARNLEKISKYERLSVDAGGVNCFEAISGVYRSLKRLHEHEIKMAQTLEGTKGVSASNTEAACKRSGWPKMNVRRTVGLSVEYWRDRHCISSSDDQSEHVPTVTATQDELMTDVSPRPETAPGNAEDDDACYTIHVDIQPCPSSLYPTIRTSNLWISESVVKAPLNPLDSSVEKTDISQPQGFDWQDPSTNVLTQPPEARFMAQLDPPVTVRLAVASEMFASVGAELDASQEQLHQTTFEASLLADLPQMSQRKVPSSMSQPIVSSIPVAAFDGHGEEKEEQWQCRLYFPRPELAKTVEGIPFSHPRQVVAMLPVLRQHALFSRLVRSTTKANEEPIQNADGGFTLENVDDVAYMNGAQSADDINFSAGTDQNIRNELDALFEDTPSNVSENLFSPDEEQSIHFPKHPFLEESSIPRIVDTTVTLSPQPHLSVITTTSLGLLIMQVTVALNAEISVTATSETVDALLSDIEDEADRAEKRQRFEQGLKQALEVSDDIPTWTEWIRGKVAHLASNVKI